MTRAPSSNRGTRVTLMLGLANIELNVFSTTVSDYGIQRKQFREVEGEEDHEVGFRAYDKVTNEGLTAQQIVKKVATEHGFVYVEDGEIEQLFSLEPLSLTIKSVHPMNLLRTGAIITKSRLVVEAAPRKGSGRTKVPNRTGRIALKALLEALEGMDGFALAEMVTRGKPKPVALTPTGDLLELFWDEEVRLPRPVEMMPAADLAQVERFREPFTDLLADLWSDRAEQPSDVRTALIQGFADEKAQAGDFGKPVDVAAPAVEAVDDLDALMASLDASVKKATPAKAAPKRKAAAPRPRVVPTPVEVPTPASEPAKPARRRATKRAS